MINPYALIYLLSYIGPAAIGFLALIVYTHLLSPAEYGLYVVGSSIAGVVSALFFAWVRQSVSRYQARAPQLDLRIEAAVAFVGTVAVVACLAPVAILIVRPNVELGTIAGALFLSFSLTAFEISQEFRRARLNPRRFAAIAFLRSALGLVLGLSAIQLGGGGLGLLFAIAISFLVANIVSFERDLTKPLNQVSIDYLAQFARYGLPFSLGAVAFALHGVVDRLGVAYLLGQSGAGYYGIAADITRQLVGIIASSVAAALFPIAFRSLAEQGPAATRARLKEGIELLLALIGPVAIWLAIAANVVASALLGSEFQASVGMLLPLLAIGRMCGAVNQFYLHISFQLAERPLLQVLHESLILTLNIALLFVLTPAFGLSGAASAVLIAEAFGIPLGIWLSRRAFPLPFDLAGMIRLIAATAVMAAATYTAKIAFEGHGIATLLIVGIAGGIAYAGAALLLDLAGLRSMIASYLRPRLATSG